MHGECDLESWIRLHSVPLSFLSSCVVVVLHDFLTGHNGITESGTFLIRWLRTLGPGGLLCRACRSFRRRTAVCIVFWWRWRWFDCSVHIQIGIMCVGTWRPKSTTPLAIVPAYFLAVFHLCVCICVDLLANRKSDKFTLNGTLDMFYLIEAIYTMIVRTDTEYPVPTILTCFSKLAIFAFSATLYGLLNTWPVVLVLDNTADALGNVCIFFIVSSCLIQN